MEKGEWVQEIREALRGEIKAREAQRATRIIKRYSEELRQAMKVTDVARLKTRRLLVVWLKQMVEERVGFEANAVLTSEYLGLQFSGKKYANWKIGTICFWKGTELAPNRWANKIKIRFLSYGPVFSKPDLGTQIMVSVTTDPAYLGSTAGDLQAKICEFVRESSRGILWEVENA